VALTPHVSVSFNGNCEAAFDHYASSLGGTIESLFRYRGSPFENQVPPEWGDKVMHAFIRIGALKIAGADVVPDKYQAPSGFQVMLAMADPAEAERVFAALADGGDVKMPLQPTFWAARFGVLVDRFGIPWSINCDEAPAA
jgi:PhnB protein